MPLQQAYEYVKSRRRICPNLGFMLVLSEFEKTVLENKPQTRVRTNNPLNVLIVEDEDKYIEPTVAVVLL